MTKPKLINIEKLAKFIEEEISGYLYSEFESLHKVKYTLHFKKPDIWELKEKNSDKPAEKLKATQLIEKFNEHLILLADLHGALYHAAMNFTLYHTFRANEGIKLFGAEQVTEARKQQLQFGAELVKMIEKEVRKKSFKVIKGDKNE